METINNIELIDENIYPDEAVIQSVIGSTFIYYQALLNLFGKHELAYEWRYYRDGKAWLCKVQKKKKTIVWMSAWPEYMQATIYVPDRYIQDIYDLDIREEIKDIIRSKKKVGKSQPCVFEIRNHQILDDLEKVMIYKMLM